MKNTYNILVRKCEEKSQFGRPRRRWENNIGKGLGDVVWKVVHWNRQAQVKDHWREVVNTVMNLVP
jgi:hypothetical protein